MSFTCGDALSGVAACGPTPQTVSQEGANLSSFAAVTDLARNSASATVGNVNIDKTAPAAFNQFDPVTKTLQVFGRDGLSGVPTGPIAPISVKRIHWHDDDDEDHGRGGHDGDDDDHRGHVHRAGDGHPDDDDNDRDGDGDDESCRERTRERSAELRTYRITDRPGMPCCWSSA